MGTSVRRHAAAGLAALVLAICMSAAWAQMSVEVIALKYRTAEEVIPILQPMLAREGSLSGLRGQLVVRTTPANLKEIQRILASVDVAPRRLVVSVAQDTAAGGSRTGAEISGSLRADDHLRLTVPGSSVPERDRIEARIYDSRGSSNVRVLQTVQVLEGRSAYIQVGTNAPVPQRRIVRSVVNGQVVDQVVDATDYRQADTGFHVTPRVSGDRVTLEIAPQREAFVQRPPGAIDVQRVVTTVSGRIGEWIEVAASSQDRAVEREVILGRAGGVRSETRSVLLKVDELR